MRLEESNMTFDKLQLWHKIVAVSDVLKIQCKILDVTKVKSLLLRFWLYYEDTEFLSVNYIFS